jgi:iron(III) transport system permease protein
VAARQPAAIGVAAQGAPPARPDLAPGVMLGAVAVVAFVILALLAGVLWISLQKGGAETLIGAPGLANYAAIVGDATTWRVVATTLEFSAYTLVVAFIFGLPVAWLAERTDLPGRSLLFALMTVGLLNPGFTSAMGWLFVLHPRVGILNKWLMEEFGLGRAPFDIASVAGMGWVQGLNLAPLAFIMTAATFRAMDPVLEEAALVCRAGFIETMLRVTLRLAWPGILAAGIFIFMIGFAAFDVPAVIGWSNRIFTFSTYMVSLVGSNEGLPQYGRVAALAALSIAIALVLAWIYNRMQRQARRYEVVTGKGYRPRLTRLGHWAWVAWGFIGLYLLLGIGLPVLLLIWASLLPYLQLPTARAFAALSLDNYRDIGWSLAAQAMGNTGLLMVLAATITIALSIAFSWTVLRTRMRSREAIDFVAFLPHVIPSVVFGIAALLMTLFLVDRVVPIYGTVWILLAVFVIGRISYGTRMTNSALIQLHAELVESGRICGAATWPVLRSVVLPLIAPTLVYAWMWIALLCYRELTLAVVLTTTDNLTLPVLIWNLWNGGEPGVAAALALVMLTALLPLIGLYWMFADRRLMLRQTG